MYTLPQRDAVCTLGFSLSNWTICAKLFSMTWRTSGIIFNWRRRASHNQMTWELGLSEKWKRRNDFGLNHKRTEYCAYVFFWISSKFIPLPGISLSPRPPLAKFFGIPSSRLPGISTPPQLLSRRSFHRSMAFQHCGIPQHPFDQLEDELLCTACSGSSYHVFGPSQRLLSRVREMNSRSSCRRVWTEGQSSVSSLKSPVLTS